MIARLAMLALIASAMPLAAQSPLDASVRTGPQFVSYRLGAPVGRTIEQLAIPVAAVIPFGSRFFVDIATAYASTTASGGSPDSRISGLTDTQLRATWTSGNDALVLTAGVNIPTGHSTVEADQIEAAGRIGSDFLAFPISNMGTGLAATAGLGVAQPLGNWNVGAGLSLRHSQEYEPFDVGGQRPRFQPGDELRLRIGADRALASGRLALGATYSAFGNDQAGSFTYNTGDRWVAQTGYSRRIAGAEVGISAWNLLRTSGRRAVTEDSSATTPWENIASVGLSAGFTAGGMQLEPSVELRHWSRGENEAEPDGSIGQVATVGLRTRFSLAGLDAIPSVSFTGGGVETIAGRASVSGWRGGIVLRYGR